LFVLIMLFLLKGFIISMFFSKKNIFKKWYVCTTLKKQANSDEFLQRFELEKYIFNNDHLLSIIDFIVYFFRNLFGIFTSLITQDVFTNKITNLYNNRFYLFNNSVALGKKYQLFLYGLRSIWGHLKFWVLPLLIAILFIYYSFFVRSLPFSKVFFGYLLLANMFYLFISGFIFFFKKYQYRLYTSAIQRFWRRTLMVFWIIEGFLFSIFVYLIFNSSQEPIHMYDNLQIYKTHLYSWRFFLPKILTSTFIIVLTYMLLLSLKWNTFTKTNNFILLITILLLYISWLEFYQLFHLMNSYGVSNWVYDFSEHLWNLELEFKRTRIVNHYVTIGLIAKFWHVIFAVVFWIFFIFRGIESSRYRYPLLVSNLQNFLIIYILSWLYMYPWFRNVIRRGMDMPYFWFFINNRRFGFYLFINDIKLYILGFFDFLQNIFDIDIFFLKSNFFYWYESSSYLSNTQYRKQNIRDLFILNIK